MFLDYRGGIAVRFGIGVLLLLVISGSLTEFSRLLIPYAHGFRVIHYAIFPAFVFVAIDRLSRQSFRFRLPHDVRRGVLLLGGPVLLVYALDTANHLARGLQLGVAQSVTVSAIAALLYITLLMPALLPTYSDGETYLVNLLWPYVLYVLFTAAVTSIVAPLVWLGFIDVYNWPIPNLLRIDGQFASGRVEFLRMPLFITLVERDPFGVYRFQGLSQEPHTYALFSAPALFMWLYLTRAWQRWKQAVGALLILISLVATLSTTALIVGVSVGTLVVLRGTKPLPVMRVLRRWVFFLAALTALGIYVARGGLVKGWFLFKFAQEVEQGTHKAALSDVVSWNSLYGTGILHAPDSLHIGLVSGLLYTVVLLWVAVFTARIIWRRTPESVLALGMIYYLIHGLKSPLHAYSQPLFLYLCFIVGIGYTSARLHRSTATSVFSSMGG